MAITSYGTNDPLAVKLWAKRLSVEVLKNVWLARFMGDSSGSVLQVRDETNKSAGDKVTYGLRMQLTGGGVIGDGTLEGQEEPLTTFSDSLVINQLRHAVNAGGKMSQQRVPFSVREEALSGLRDWWADRIDWSGFNALCGFTPVMTPNGALGVTDTRWTGLQAPTAPDTGHIFRPALSGNPSTQDESIATTDLFSLTLLDRAVERARTVTPAIRPVMVGGKPFYPAFLHPFQVTDLRTNVSSGQWLDIQKAAMTGGEVEDNPIFDGSLGVYNGVILHSDYRVTQGVNSGAPLTAVTAVRRAIFLGAQAGMVAYGRENGPERYTWVEKLFDFDNVLGVAAGLIWGLKKTVFNSLDFATIVMSTYAAAH